MNARNIFASVSLLMCLSSAAFATDYRVDGLILHSNIHTIGWDQRSLEAQMQGAVYLRAQIEKLEQQNEQLRNSLSQMRGKAIKAAPIGRDPRIQALIEENKRLSNALLSSQSQNNARQVGISADVYMQKLYVLEAENQKIKKSLTHALTQSGGESAFLKQENMRLKSSLSTLSSSGTGYQSRISNLEKDIRNLKGKNAVLLSSSSSFGTGYQSQITALEKKIRSLREENIALSASSSTSGVNYLGRISGLETEIRGLKGENAALLSSSSTSGKTSKATINKITSLQNTVQELQVENRKLGQTLANSSNKLLGLHERADLARNEKDVNSRSITTLKSTLAQAQKENASLNQTIKTLKSRKQKPSVVANSSGIQSLKKQNQSLRETIRAQNEVLVSADNATKTAERLLTENAILKRQVTLAGKVGLSNGKSAKELFVRNAKLESEIKQRNNYIQRLEGLKDTVKQLRLANDKYVMGKATSNSVKKRFSALKAEMQNSNDLLKKERTNATQYKIKIREYQEEIAGIKNGQSKEMASKISDYQSKMLLLEKGQESQDGEITALKLENQELKAQIKLSSEEANVEKVKKVKEAKRASKKNTIVARAHEDETPAADVVTFVETSYPPVEQIAPLLDRDGAHRYDKEEVFDEEDLTLLSETLLSQELKPLPDQ